MLAFFKGEHTSELPTITFFPELLRFFHKITALRIFFINYVFWKFQLCV